MTEHVTPEFVHHGSVELLDSMGGDLAVVRKARQTMGRHSGTMPDWGPKLIHRMMESRHGTPFEAAVFDFQVQCKISVAREWFRHRIGSFNEFSLRATKAKPRFQIPRCGEIRTETEDRYVFEKIEAGEAVDKILREYESAYADAWLHYECLLRLGLAKELARDVLPFGMITTFGWTVNARALMNFVSLRTAPDAMLEIRLLAQQVEESFKEAMPHTWSAFDRAGRVAP